METHTFDNFMSGMDARFNNAKGGFRIENGRTRENVVAPIKAPRKLAGLPNGKRQGIYAFGEWVVTVVDGGFWYYFDGSWRHVGAVKMDPDVDVVYVEQVPISTNNFPRQELFPGSSYQRTPSGLVVCDGINQPWIVFADGTSRRLRTYEQWNTANREYVPIGIMPRMIGDALYIIGKDSNGKYTQILRSVSGRPLDFVINVTPTANKNGDAYTTSHAVGFADLTNIFPTPQQDVFLVTSQLVTTAVQLDRSIMLFGEPTLRNYMAFPIGMLDYFSYGESMGDIIFADSFGLNTFNLVQQTQERSNNQPFFQQIVSLVPPRINKVRFASHNNYLLVSIKDTGVLVFDKVLNAWVSLDLIDVDGFAVNAEDRLFFYNDEGVFEYYGSTEENLTCRIKVGNMFTGAHSSPHGFVVAHNGIDRIGHRLLLDNEKGVWRELQAGSQFGSFPFMESKEPICDSFAYEFAWRQGTVLGFTVLYQRRDGMLKRAHRSVDPLEFTVPVRKTRVGEVEFFFPGDIITGDAKYKIRVPEQFEPGEIIYVTGYAIWSANRYYEV